VYTSFYLKNFFIKHVNVSIFRGDARWEKRLIFWTKIYRQCNSQSISNFFYS